MKKVIFLMLWVVSVLCFADTLIPSESIWYQGEQQHSVRLRVELYLSSTCPHCQQADDYFTQLQSQNDWFEVQRYFVNQDKSAIRQFYQRLRAHNEDSFAVPAIFFCDTHWTGFHTAKDSGDILLKNMQYCYQHVSKDGRLTPHVRHVLAQQAAANAMLDLSQPFSHALSVVFLAGMADAFAVCNFFCFTAFVAFLWLLPWRAQTEYLGGGAMALMVLLLHMIQQQYADFFNVQAYGFVALNVILAMVLVFMLVKKQTYGKALLFIAIPVIAVMYLNQQTCVLNVAYVFEQWLSTQSVLPIVRLLYLILYQLSYILPLLCAILIWSVLRRFAFIKQRARHCTRFARIFLIYAALLLLLYPRGLSQAIYFYGCLILSGLSGWLFKYFYQDKQI